MLLGLLVLAVVCLKSAFMSALGRCLAVTVEPLVCSGPVVRISAVVAVLVDVALDWMHSGVVVLVLVMAEALASLVVRPGIGTLSSVYGALVPLGSFARPLPVK